MSNEKSSEHYNDKRLGFFIYLIVESVMFATLFATYFVFTSEQSTPSPTDVFEAKSVIISSFVLVLSSATLLISEKGLSNKSPRLIVLGLVITFLLGLGFVGIEIREFFTYINEGYTLTTNVFLSSFYVLVGLHAAHVLFGTIWMILLFYQLMANIPFSLYVEKQRIFHYYWHFVDLIWVCIVIFVYKPYLF
ncbi:cytochrome c oxidase subunit 3 [Aquibacillus saliphilus]|uniref:cytochrome c oxidase subunit 3 n=1 Tax=Aquibacillus saliphilus TaxID=1909422 RepID=UPI001CEFB463|nr:cytochrome c oxidase subunit 3 [Aquibacillus saliphilus]